MTTFTISLLVIAAAAVLSIILAEYDLLPN